MPRHLPLSLLLCLGTLTACRSAQTRNADLTADRTAKLHAAAPWSPTWCGIEARLSAPAAARYREIFPEDVARLGDATLPYTWKATGPSCEVTPLHQSPLAVNYRGFLDVALCLLMQTHLVNSPFSNLKPTAVEPRDGRTFMRTGTEADLGIYLDPKIFEIETVTKNRGVLTVTYANQDGDWLPVRLTQKLAGTTLTVDQITYDPVTHHARRAPRTFALSVGDQTVSPHSDVTITECQPY